MDIAGVLVGFVQCFWEPLSRQFKYLKNSKKDAEALLCSTEELIGRENDIKLQIDRAVNHIGKKSNSEVQIWLKNVERVRKEVNSIEEVLQEKAKCVEGCFPNCHSRLKFAKHVKKLKNEVTELLGKGGFPNGLFIDPLPERGRSIPTTALMGRTATEISEMIWDSLMNVNIKKIGVYGMGGVGKTTIMMHINNQLTESQTFDSVIWVSVTKPLNLVKLQSDIARAIDLDLFDHEDETGRSTRLFENMVRKKRFVLILDDLWQNFPLEKIGIPQPNTENGCKLVFTTRLMEVCRGMETQREIKVEVLSKEEAWDLFIDKVGSDVMSSSEIEATAKNITEECGGLPLAIITVGRAMRKVNNIRIWRNALEELKNSRAEIEGMEDDVFARLKFSFNHLKNDRLRACLLYCALYPQDHKIEIEELVEYWMAEELIDEIGDREKEIDKGHSILNELKDACMIEGIGTKCVKIHDLVRDLAISITRNTPRFSIHAGMGLKRFPRIEQIEDVERISLMENSMLSCASLNDLKSSKLSTLLLQRNYLLKNIRSSFFEHMYKLRVLDLSDTDLKLLPDSISNLCNLHYLSLRYCKLKKLPSLAKLKELRVLDLSYTYIRVLPKDIGGLKNLRRLDLSYTEKLQRFPGKAIPKFQHLEHLSMFKSRCRWSESAEMQRGACLAEIVNFPRLTNLGISFKDLNSLTSYVKSKHWKVLRSYHLGIGLLSRFMPISKGSFSVEIQGCNLASDNSLIVLPENTLQLALQGCHDITRLSKLPCISNLSELKDCYISRCNKMECIASAEENILPCLDRLVLRKLSNLTALCDGVAGRSLFAGLKVLHIHSCNGLTNLFSHRLLQQIQTLEEIEVWNSILIEEIVKDEENITITLPRLRRLYFFSLPKLRNIYDGVLICNSLTTIDIYDCQKLKKLPLSGDDLPLNLQHIKGSKKWWDALEWDNEGSQILLQPFFAEDMEEDDEELVGDRDPDDDDDDADAEEDDDSDDDTFETAR